MIVGGAVGCYVPVTNFYPKRDVILGGCSEEFLSNSPQTYSSFFLGGGDNAGYFVLGG